jgi:hypothetical protein
MLDRVERETVCWGEVKWMRLLHAVVKAEFISFRDFNRFNSIGQIVTSNWSNDQMAPNASGPTKTGKTSSRLLLASSLTQRQAPHVYE